MVDVHLEQKYPSMISIEQLRQYPELEDMLVLRRGNRLSITPVTKLEWDFINELC